MLRLYSYVKCVPLVLYFLLSIALSTSCDFQRSPFNSAGKSREMVVVLPQSAPEDMLKAELRALFGSPIPYLPQAEPEVDLIFTKESSFRGIFKNYRNILILEPNPERYTSSKLRITKNVWAKGQQVFVAQSTDLPQLVKLLERQHKLIERRVYEADICRDLVDLKKTFSSKFAKAVEKTFPDFTINIPTDLEWMQEKDGFLWASNLGKGNRGRLDICLYSLPYTDPAVFTVEPLLAKRDSVMKINVPGEYENSYMRTETRFGADYHSRIINGEFRAELRGLWVMEGDMMGGPFVQHILVSPDHSQLLVAETYVYAPQLDEKKRLLMIGEAALYSLRASGQELMPKQVFTRNVKPAKRTVTDE